MADTRRDDGPWCSEKAVQVFRYVDLFAGCGGLSLGIEKMGGELQLAVEKSDMAAHTFYVNFIDESLSAPEWHLYLKKSIADQGKAGVAVSPLRDVLDDETTMSRLVAQGVDVVVGGPPCQGFSLAGRRNPDDVRNKLPWEYLEFVGRTNPKVVVIENVVGMNHRFAQDEEPPFVQLQQALRETGSGYVVQGVAVNAAHYGAPQNRPRLMIIGVREDVARAAGVRSTGVLWASHFVGEGVGALPDLAPVPTVRRDQALTVADAIGDLQTAYPETETPQAAQYRSLVRTKLNWGLKSRGISGPIPNQTPRAHSKSTQQRFRIYQWMRDNHLNPRLLADLAADPRGAKENVLAQLSACRFPAFAPDGTELAASADEMLAVMIELKTRKHTQKALDWLKPARTVVTLPDDYVHPSAPRIFTVREMARFQGFPDDFVFMGKETTGSLRRRFEVPQYSQVGNAVSPMLAAAVGGLIRVILARATTLPQADSQHVDLGDLEVSLDAPAAASA